MPTVCRCSCKAPRPMRPAAFSPNRGGSVVDADRVVNNVDIRETDAAPPPRFSLDMLRNGDGIQIIGLVPGDERRREVAERDRGHRRRRGSHRHGRNRRFPAAGHMDLGARLRPARPCGNCRDPRSRSMPTAWRSRPSATAPSSRRSFWRSCRGTAGRGRGRPRHLRAASGLLAVPAACGSRCAGASPRQLRRRHAARAGAYHRRRAARRRHGRDRLPHRPRRSQPQLGQPRSKRGLPRWSSWEAGPCRSATRPSR
jgi:hypothetical protein